MLIAPFGRYGTITDVLYDETAGLSTVSALNGRSFTAFLRDVYGITVDQHELMFPFRVYIILSYLRR